jgi:hypothetical protein
VTAPQPDTRTPGTVALQAEREWCEAPDLSVSRYERVAAAVLAHDADQRAARGEVVVPRMHIETLISVAEEFNPRLTRQTRSELQAALAAPTPKETDR